MGNSHKYYTTRRISMEFLSKLLNWVYPTSTSAPVVEELVEAAEEAPVETAKEEVKKVKRAVKKKEPKVEDTEVKSTTKKPARKKPSLKVEK
jgi:hypothetical protein